jgi:hypothetical protein
MPDTTKNFKSDLRLIGSTSDPIQTESYAEVCPLCGYATKLCKELAGNTRNNYVLLHDRAEKLMKERDEALRIRNWDFFFTMVFGVLLIYIVYFK